MSEGRGGDHENRPLGDLALRRGRPLPVDIVGLDYDFWYEGRQGQ
jgi:hypothetical protein